MTSYNSFNTKQHAELYSKFRPDYPHELFDIILKYVKEKHNGPYTLAVDVGCGSGQSTLPLAPYFQQVIGLDCSEAQITQAKKHETKNISFQVGSAFLLPVADCSTDLVTVGTAAHWFSHIDDFYKEVERILKPGGCLVLYCRLHPRLTSEKCYQVLATWYDKFQSYIADAVLAIHNERYRGFKMPLSDTQRIERSEILVKSLADYCGIISTTSYIQRYKESHPEEPDSTDMLKARLHDVLDPEHSKSDKELYLEICYDMDILFSRKPAQN